MSEGGRESTHTRTPADSRISCELGLLCVCVCVCVCVCTEFRALKGTLGCGSPASNHCTSCESLNTFPFALRSPRVCRDSWFALCRSPSCLCLAWCKTYDIFLTPSIEHLNVTGTVNISVQVSEESKYIIMHALDMDIDGEWLLRGVGGGGSGRERGQEKGREKRNALLSLSFFLSFFLHTRTDTDTH